MDGGYQFIKISGSHDASSKLPIVIGTIPESELCGKVIYLEVSFYTLEDMGEYTYKPIEFTGTIMCLPATITVAVNITEERAVCQTMDCYHGFAFNTTLTASVTIIKYGGDNYYTVELRALVG